MLPYGLGCYRMADGSAVHEAAMRHALDVGCTLIDTSTNYGDGASESLVGRVLADHATNNDVRVITKIGYIQGTTMQLVRSRIANGDPFPEVVQLDDAVWHCIAPEFLEHQRTASLRRLQRASVAAILLHNPEYFLIDAHRRGMAVADARRHFERRLRLAFETLESFVADGSIASYGISSNTFPCESDDPTFCSLERCLEIAERVGGAHHHFRIVQMPMNIVEHHAITTLNQRDRTASTLEVAADAGLQVLINRPLNAVADDDLIRLATHVVAMPVLQTEVIDARVHALEADEHQASQIVAAASSGQQRDALAIQETFRVAASLCGSWHDMRGLPHWNDVASMFLRPRVDVMLRFAERYDAPLVRDVAERLLSLFDDVTAWYAAQENESLEELRHVLAQHLGLPQATPLHHIALHCIRSTMGVSTVLVGMRTPAYVDDVCTASQLPASQLDRSAWLAIVDHLQRLSQQEPS